MGRANLIRSYAEGWEVVHGADSSVRDSSERWFAKNFPDGHATSIRPIAASFAERLARGKLFEKGTEGYLLNEFHPRAMALLAKYGVDYTPFDWAGRNPQNSPLQPTLGQCFSNAWRMMEGMNRGKKKLKKPMVYVEGLTVGALVPPMLHAWNAFGLDDTVAFDWSHYIGSEWNRQLGIPVSEEEHWHMCKLVHPRKPKLLTRLLHTESFPTIEPFLTDLLARRSEQPVASQ